MVMRLPAFFKLPLKVTLGKWSLIVLFQAIANCYGRQAAPKNVLCTRSLLLYICNIKWLRQLIAATDGFQPSPSRSCSSCSLALSISRIASASRLNCAFRVDFSTFASEPPGSLWLTGRARFSGSESESDAYTDGCDDMRVDCTVAPF